MIFSALECKIRVKLLAKFVHLWPTLKKKFWILRKLCIWFMKLDYLNVTLRKFYKNRRWSFWENCSWKSRNCLFSESIFIPFFSQKCQYLGTESSYGARFGLILLGREWSFFLSIKKNSCDMIFSALECKMRVKLLAKFGHLWPSLKKNAEFRARCAYGSWN